MGLRSQMPTSKVGPRTEGVKYAVLCINSTRELPWLNLCLLITSRVVFIRFYWPIKSLFLGKKLVLKHQDLHLFGLKLNKYE